MHSKKSYAIGMFDSGVGGLTVMQKMVETLPYERIVYFGDTARVPYGGKSQETVLRYSIENIQFLLQHKIKLLVVACNTVTALALPKLREMFNIPIIGVIEPGAEKAASVTRNQRIAVLGTKATILSQAYQKELQRLLPNASIFSLACPLFVALVEENFLEHPASQLIVKEYLHPLKDKHIDTLLLGCTHYPLLKHLIAREVGEQVTIVDSASTCAEKVSRILQEQDLSTDINNQRPLHQYFVSDDPKRVKEQAEKLFGYTISEVNTFV